MARTSNFANVATVTRASTKTDAGGWDFTNGGTVGTLTEYASGVAAIHSTAGLLVEGSTTNEIRNPRCEGAVAGTPGTSPTNWSISTTVLEIIGTGTEDGSPYVEARFNGTFSGTNSIFFDTSTAISASAGQTWTIAAGIKLVAGSLSNVSSVIIGAYEYAAGVFQAQSTSSILSNITSSHLRSFYTTTLSGGSTDAIRPGIQIVTAGAVDFTLRFYAPQCEQKAYPTSPVFPVVSSPAAATRAADYVTLSIGAWFNQPAGTLFFEYQPNTAGVAGGVLGGFGATFDNTAFISTTGVGTRWSGTVRSGASASAVMTPSGQSDYAVATNYKAAIAYAQDDFVMSLNGATQTTDTSGNVPLSPTRAVLGGAPWAASASNSVNGYIKDIRYWPKRLTNAELEALVGN